MVEDSAVKSLNERKELFVRSIPYEATSDELSDFFSNFCPVKHAVIVTDAENKSKGFGFVSFAETEDAKKALEEGRKSKFQDRYLQIDVAQPRERGAANKGAKKEEGEDEAEAEPKRFQKRNDTTVEKRRPRLIVRNLPWSCKDKKKIEKIFAKFGNVTEVLIPKKEDGKMCGFAFVTMRKKAHAQKAVDETKELKIDGRAVQVSFAIEKSKWISKQNGGGDNEDDSEEYDESDSEEEDEEDKKPERKKSGFKAASNEQTVFVRNIPYDTTEEALQEHFEEFGPVLYALPVFDKKLNQPRGTAFVAFENIEDCAACIVNAPTISSTSLLLPDDVDARYVFEGRVLSITGALQREKAEELATASTAKRQELLGKAPKDKDRRNLFLLNEGRIPKESKLAAHMTAQEIEVREKSFDQRKQQLNKNPGLHLSLTRLAVRNIPRAMSEKGLKALGRKAVVEFAKEVTEKKRQPLSKEETQRSTKHNESMGTASKSKHGVVRQSKIIMEEKGSGSLGRSRGYGFLEFRDHKTALMGLRWLNAHEVSREELLSGLTEEEISLKVQNPEDTKRRRLVVEFAIEHAEITKRRKESIIKARVAASKRKADEEAGPEQEDNSKSVKKETSVEDNTKFIIAKKRKMRKLNKN